MDSTAELLSISAFARRVGLTPSALRFYDDCRVLPPASVDGTTGYRYYTPDQEERAALLRGLRAAGVPLAEVAVVLDGPGSEARTVLERHRERVRERTRAADAAIESVLRSLDGSRAPAEVTLGGVELASAARQVVPAAGADERYPAVGCVLIEIEDGEIRFVATDRYRLSLRTLRPLAVKGPPGRLLLAAEVLAGLGGWAARAAEVTLEVHPDAARAHGLGEVRELPVSRERFPGYREMLSALTPPAHRAVVDRAELAGAVERCGPVRAVVLALAGDRLSVSPADGLSRTAVLTAVRQDAGSARVGFDPAVLLSALESSVGPDVLLEIATPAEPVVVRSADQGGFTTLVMPVALGPKEGALS
ncbi:MerR family transcriptional regulator [Streptomyces katsurahamanus]|uniref:MerR family transcriptional regulator n=1 Tax=Streptomyces katsurahamanus TaxID=2577098 RepID=A0ABW9NZU8_9ACTN|nr:MerR family transcriptional regulator [Streptomyces katsurahamanus]MQS38856.1 MerR family transcriptional regulator [Streptomyces katsurahamanus]